MTKQPDNPAAELAQLRAELAEAKADCERLAREAAAYVETWRNLAAELAADVAHHEAGNPWRLDSLKAVSRALTGEPYGFDSWPVFKARAERGTTGGRFRNPWADMQAGGLS